MHLTRDEIQILIQACQELKRFMTGQMEEIEAFLKIRSSDDARRALNSIRERHRPIYERLDSLALRLPNNHSKELLRNQLEEVASSMARKRVLWNDRSRPLEMGWLAAAERYWPRIADKYTILIEIIGSFKKGLEKCLGDETLWSNEARRQYRRTGFKYLRSALKGSSRGKPKPESKGKHVVFEETYHWRVFSDEDAPTEAGEAHADAQWLVYGRGTDFVGKLTGDRKGSTKAFHARAHEKRKDLRVGARYCGSRRQAEANGREKERGAKKRETGPVFGRRRVETKGRRSRTALLLG